MEIQIPEKIHLYTDILNTSFYDFLRILIPQRHHETINLQLLHERLLLMKNEHYELLCMIENKRKAIFPNLICILETGIGAGLFLHVLAFFYGKSFPFVYIGNLMQRMCHPRS